MVAIVHQPGARPHRRSRASSRPLPICGRDCYNHRLSLMRRAALSLTTLLACNPNAPASSEPSTSSSADSDTTATTVAPGSSGAPTSGGDTSGTGTTGEPDPETALMVHSFGKYTMQPFEETEPCVQWTLNNEQAVYINTVTLANDGGFHHSNWLVVPESQFAGEDGYFNCWDRGFSELQAAITGTVLFAQSTQSRYEAQELPEGVVIKVPPRHKLIAGVHLLNLSSEATDSELRMGLSLIHPRDVTTIVAPFRLNYQDLKIPPLAQSRFTGECMLADPYKAKSGVALDLKLYHVLPHYHYLGNYFSVEIIGGPRDGEQIFLHTGFNADGNGRTYSPPIDLGGALGLRFTCGYDNWRDKEINYGIGDQEMCTMLGLADMRVMMNGSVDGGTALTGNDGEILEFSGGCSVFALPKSKAQTMPTPEEQSGPLYVPPAADGDLDLDPVKPCVDVPLDAVALEPPTLASLRETVFNPSCTFSSCHGGKAPVSVRLDGADLHAVLLGQASGPDIDMPLVDPGKPENSWLYQLLSRCEPGDGAGNIHTHMPYNAPTLLEPRLVAKLRAWISAGAPAQ
jgi:hypothetical protein